MSVAVSPRIRIIDAAIACFARAGFHGASMQEICAEAGMSPGALYRYFPSKVSIIAAIAEAERAHHTAFFERLAEADDPVEALASIGIDTLEQMLSGPNAALCAETMAEAVRNPEVRGMFDRNLIEARTAVVAALKRGRAAGTPFPVTANDLPVVVYMIAAVYSFVIGCVNVHPAAPINGWFVSITPAVWFLVVRWLRPDPATVRRNVYFLVYVYIALAIPSLLDYFIPNYGSC